MSTRTTHRGMKAFRHLGALMLLGCWCQGVLHQLEDLCQPAGVGEFVERKEPCIDSLNACLV